MAKLFHLEILTPERRFFDDEAEAVTILTSDGEWTILADHAPLVLSLAVGSVRIKRQGEWREAFNSEGFMEVRAGGVIIFAQACEWPDEIDARRAAEAERRAEEMLRQKTSIREYRISKLALARAMARLRITRTRTGFH